MCECDVCARVGVSVFVCVFAEDEAMTKLLCPGCGSEIGDTVWIEEIGEWRIRVGSMMVYHADGVCEICGFHWHWTAGRKRGIIGKNESGDTPRIEAKSRSLPPDCAQC